MKNLFCSVVFIVVLIKTVLCEANEVIANQKSEGWFRSAQTMLAGPAGQMVVHVAKELINRSIGNSQILSLNLSNLLILVLLKALIFAAGLIGAGHWSQYARGRSINNSLINEGEPMLFLGYLTAQGSGDNTCLHKAACLAPTTAYEYAKAAKALLNGISQFGGNSENNSQYNSLIEVIERAAYDGYKGAPCELMYNCIMY